MERCDFSSISTCLKNQISESNQMNQPDFLYETLYLIFDYPYKYYTFKLFEV